MIRMPAAVKTASNASVYLASRSLIRNFRPPVFVAEIRERVPGLLCGPGGGGVGGAAGQVHAAMVVLDDEQYVEAAQEYGIDVEEVGPRRSSGPGRTGTVFRCRLRVAERGRFRRPWASPRWSRPRSCTRGRSVRRRSAGSLKSGCRGPSREQAAALSRSRAAVLVPGAGRSSDVSPGRRASVGACEGSRSGPVDGGARRIGAG